jgi:hypothetical protein
MELSLLFSMFCTIKNRLSLQQHQTLSSILKRYDVYHLYLEYVCSFKNIPRYAVLEVFVACHLDSDIIQITSQCSELSSNVRPNVRRLCKITSFAIKYNFYGAVIDSRILIKVNCENGKGRF